MIELSRAERNSDSLLNKIRRNESFPEGILNSGMYIGAVEGSCISVAIEKILSHGAISADIEYDYLPELDEYEHRIVLAGEDMMLGRLEKTLGTIETDRILLTLKVPERVFSSGPISQFKYSLTAVSSNGETVTRLGYLS